MELGGRQAILCKVSDDLVLHCFGFLSAESLSLMVQLNRRYSKIAKEDILWFNLLAAEVGRESSIPRITSCLCNDLWMRRFVAWRTVEACVCEGELVCGQEQRPQVPDATSLAAECTRSVWLHPSCPARVHPKHRHAFCTALRAHRVAGSICLAAEERAGS